MESIRATRERRANARIANNTRRNRVSIDGDRFHGEATQCNAKRRKATQSRAAWDASNLPFTVPHSVKAAFYLVAARRITRARAQAADGELNKEGVRCLSHTSVADLLLAGFERRNGARGVRVPRGSFSAYASAAAKWKAAHEGKKRRYSRRH